MDFASEDWLSKCSEQCSLNGRAGYNWRIPNGKEKAEEGQEAVGSEDLVSPGLQERKQVLSALSSILFVGHPS
jgi:hypothetical protein